MRLAYATLLPAHFDERFVRPPLAAGYLTAYTTAHRPGMDDHDIVSAVEQTRLTTLDKRTERILRSDPEVVALTVFVWNHLRVAALCKSIRRLSPRTKIVLGGPEVAFTPAEAHARFDADWVCTGEGEIPFLNLIQALDRDNSFSKSLPGMLYRTDRPEQLGGIAPLVKHLDDIPSPYASGILTLDEDGFVDLETTRGCPYHCSFCLYGKTFDTLRHFSLERTELDVKYAIDNGATIIYLMDPTFNYPRERCRKVCRVLARLNHKRKVEFHTEARAEVMDSALADDFVRAGIVSVEIGLQSTSRETLKLMKRGLGTSHFVNGCKLLFDRGITTEIGMIAGLPGDTGASVRATADFVLKGNLGELTVHRLQMLPGSEYFKTAKELGLVYSPKPPYFIQKTPTMDETTIVNVVDTLEKVSRRPNREYNRQVRENHRAVRDRERAANRIARAFCSKMRGIRRWAAVEMKKYQGSYARRATLLRELFHDLVDTGTSNQPAFGTFRTSCTMSRRRRSALMNRYMTCLAPECEEFNPLLVCAFRNARRELYRLFHNVRLVALSESSELLRAFEVLQQCRDESGRYLELPAEADAPDGSRVTFSWVPPAWRHVLMGCDKCGGEPMLVKRRRIELCAFLTLEQEIASGSIRIEQLSGDVYDTTSDVHASLDEDSCCGESADSTCSTRPIEMVSLEALTQ